MPAVGFRILEVTVPEAKARIFTCVQIFSPANQPLPTEVEVEFYTQDGSAKGIIIKILCIVKMSPIIFDSVFSDVFT